jgi:hypothetical protein
MERARLSTGVPDGRVEHTKVARGFQPGFQPAFNRATVTAARISREAFNRATVKAARMSREAFSRAL